jgi:hypothetical protein
VQVQQDEDAALRRAPEELVEDLALGPNRERGGDRKFISIRSKVS